MKRRDFIQKTGMSIVAISASGFIRFDGNHFTGDCETTTDILGPYYRPDSPVKNNLVIPGEKGALVELSGKIKHTDCISPYANAKVEIWHCDNEGKYDNTSPEFRYRGTTYTDNKGYYSFKSIMPIPYGGEDFTRPAHFHLMITAKGYQPLVTQLYFEGDEHIAKDPAASASSSKKRILKLEKSTSGVQKIVYDVSMSQTLAVETVTIDRLTGVYADIKDPKNKKELFKKDNDLWLKNEVFGENYVYAGSNSFVCPGMPEGSYASLQFEILPSGDIQLTIKEVGGGKAIPDRFYLKEK